MPNTTVHEDVWPAGAFTLDQAAEVLHDAGWEVAAHDESHLVATRGSRLNLRLKGILFKSVRANMPVKLVVRRSSTAITVTASGDPGRYLFTLDMSDLYQASARSGIDALAELARASKP
ncbi:hypothetical protein GOEFS_092_00340 [Gordonia effusa NBRC 100432]|uniref:Uncharacterized protein n=1 Tax=Gordonia effusa NBRC 100432 TaxID=1077974 RepID=H0R3F8_9ACTN|nr:hypothetical protein [Gordonia effusa]GAB19609.1 hypothetical protein GOEFS_092_00340 [Gordonia effusa NBRC 100432]